MDRFVQELNHRFLIARCTDDENALFALENKKPVYLGIDPTSPSLHLGNYLGITLLKRFINNGHKAIVVLGGMTATIGDPSFRSNERVNLSRETIQENLRAIESEIKRLLPEAQIVNNYQFYEKIPILEFINDMCSTISVSELLNKDFLKDRLGKGIKLAEFLYPIFQSWDFFNLYKEYQVAIQLGGNDQWGNIVFGIDLIRKKIGPNHFASGIVFPLLVDNLGLKFGKTDGNALFINEKFTKPYKVYQYLLNLNDQLVPKLIRQLTFLELDVIHEFKDVMLMKKAMAFEICKDIYGIDMAKGLENVSNKLFTGDLRTEDFQLIKEAIPTYAAGSPIIYGDALKKLGLVESNSEINRLIESKGLFLFDEPVTDANQMLTKENSREGYYLIRKGKKTFGLVFFY